MINKVYLIVFTIYLHYKSSIPTGGFFLASAEGCSLRMHQKSPLSQKVILPAGRTTGLSEFDIYSIEISDNLFSTPLEVKSGGVAR